MSKKSDNIRVGLIGCNRRALWYGAIFDNINPIVFAKLAPASYHHLTWYNFIELKHKRAEGFQLAKIYDKNQDAARQVAEAFDNRPFICPDFRDISRDVDLVFIANESGDGKEHLTLARPGLERKIPTFIDRPFAFTVKDAKVMITLAKKNKTPLLSCSHMRMLPHLDRFKSRFAEIGPVELGIVQSHGPNPALIADGISIALFLFGDEFNGRVKSVQSMGVSPLETALLCYATPKSERILQALVINTPFNSIHGAFYATAISHRIPVHSPDLDMFVQPEGGLGVMNLIKQMIKTGAPPISYDEMIETVAVAEAGRKAYHKKTSVCLKSFR